MPGCLRRRGVLQVAKGLGDSLHLVVSDPAEPLQL